MRKPRALRPGDRIAVVAPASPFARDEFDAGVAELRRARLRAGLRRVASSTRHGYTRRRRRRSRAAAFARAWADPGDRRAHRRPRRLRQRAAPAAARRRRIRAAAQGVHRLQRQHVAPVLADAALRHRLVSRPDARGPAGARRGRLRPRHVPARACAAPSRPARSRIRRLEVAARRGGARACWSAAR